MKPGLSCLPFLIVFWMGWGCLAPDRAAQSVDGTRDAGADTSIDGSAGSAGTAGIGGSSGQGGEGGAAGASGTGGIGGTGGVGGTAGASGVAGTAGTSGAAGAAGTGGDAGDAGAGGGSTCGPCGALEECFNNKYCVAKLIPVTGGYSIDATEVTRDQYAAWLATSPTNAGQDAWCDWNNSHLPGCDWPPGTQGSYPVTCVNWCSAYAYCKAVGKRLCGKVGGGPNGFADFADPAQSQWFNACSSGGVHNYPYGGNPGTSTTNGYDPQKCNGVEKGTGSPVAVATCPGCTSSEPGYTGVYDLSGNVWEWEDSCNGIAGKADNCLFRGGAANQQKDTLRCAIGSQSLPRDYFGIFLGIRCCAP